MQKVEFYRGCIRASEIQWQYIRAPLISLIYSLDTCLIQHDSHGGGYGTSMTCCRDFNGVTLPCQWQGGGESSIA